jgi:hypothetical protein
MDDWDLFTPMFDENIHNNDIEINFYKRSKVCSYCGTIFPSRNKMFYHLGFHNINTANITNNANIAKNNTEPMYDEDIELGDYGFIEQTKHKKKKRCSVHIRLCKCKRKGTKKQVLDLTSVLANCHLGE